MPNRKNVEKIAYSEQTDEQLAEYCKDHDEEAFEEINRRYMRQIFNFAHQYAKTADVEDITQDTFLKVWKYIKQFTKGRQFRPWIFTIARNTALDHIKKRKAILFSDLDDNENDLSFSDTLQDPEPLPPKLFEDSALAAELVSVVKTLQPDYRAVLTLHYQENLTFDEIAEIMDKPMNTVKSWHRRALIKLRDQLSDKS